MKYNLFILTFATCLVLVFCCNQPKGERILYGISGKPELISNIDKCSSSISSYISENIEQKEYSEIYYDDGEHVETERIYRKNVPKECKAEFQQENLDFFADGRAVVDPKDLSEDVLERELLKPVQVIKRPEIVIKRKSYICSYNKEIRCANWSAWYLSKEHADGPYKRKELKIPGNYIEDESSLEGRQLLSDWDGVINYDHGHLCPSGDNKWDREAMRQTFYLSNMCVQNSLLNQGPWERLESTCREWAKKFQSLYIVSGPVFKTKPIKKIGVGLSIPDQFFKVVLCIDSDEPKAIGFIYDNSNPNDGDRLEYHALTIDEVEKITGYDFFSALPDELENKIESNCSLKDWKVYK